jgi:hypothetical protein
MEEITGLLETNALLLPAQDRVHPVTCPSCRPSAVLPNLVAHAVRFPARLPLALRGTDVIVDL